MDKKDLKIVFFGTPEFAVASLDKLVEGGYNVAAVVTMPDKQAGRGHHMIQSDVKKYALEKGLRILQPERLKDETFVSQLKEINADLFIVIAFRMLPEVVWGMPRLGTFNLHASLLPKYRGAAPINWHVSLKIFGAGNVSAPPSIKASCGIVVTESLMMSSTVSMTIPAPSSISRS